jgi:hypothetical protein
MYPFCIRLSKPPYIYEIKNKNLNSTIRRPAHPKKKKLRKRIFDHRSLPIIGNMKGRL